MGNVIVCGFYTEDYRRWVVPLVASLDRLGQAHDFVLAEKAGQQWETNTMAKALHILAAMDRHSHEVIVWLDVDCIVHGDLTPLADIRGDRRATRLSRRELPQGIGVAALRWPADPQPGDITAFAGLHRRPIWL